MEREEGESLVDLIIGSPELGFTLAESNGVDMIAHIIKLIRSISYAYGEANSNDYDRAKKSCIDYILIINKSVSLADFSKKFLTNQIIKEIN